MTILGSHVGSHIPNIGYLNIYGGTWMHTGIYTCIWKYKQVYAGIWRYVEIYGRIWKYVYMLVYRGIRLAR